MYLKEILLENTGPIGFIKKEMPFNTNGNPKPVVLIGQNGSGKSIFVSHIVNSLLSMKQLIYDDSEVETGKVFKYRSSAYIKSDESFSYSKVTFEQDLFQSEWQLDRNKSDFEDYHHYTPINKEWNEIEVNASNHINSNFGVKKKELKTLFESNCILYFPPNRFEEPGWLNYDNLINKVDYRFTKQLENLSNRKIINHCPLKDNQNFLLDLLFDRYALELKTKDLFVRFNQPDGSSTLRKVTELEGYEGESSNIYNEILKFLTQLFQTEDVLRFGIGKRRTRQIEILRNEKAWIKNLFNLSTGETILLNIFLTIIKDYDLSTATTFQNLSDIRGIVVIDEVDIHLHTNLQ